MSHLTIEGGIPLRGAVCAGGSKNASLPIMAASILADGPVCLLGVPQVSDVRTLGRLLACLGLDVKREGDAIRLETLDPAPIRAPDGLTRRMRATFCVLGPLLARRGSAVVPLPGGCRIGDRPVDLHLKGLMALGADIRLHRGCVVARAARLEGTTIDLSGPQGPTVTGTANVLSAAVLAHGTTILCGAAAEPEIADLAEFLNALGAKIEGHGTSTVRVTGVKRLSGGTWRVIPDRIEAATLLTAAAITRGSVTVAGAVPAHLAAVLALFHTAGCAIECGEDWIRLSADKPLRATDLHAAPYPGVPTDLQPQWTALMAIAPGRSRISDGVFPGRFLHLAELRRLGAEICVEGNAAIVTGVGRLRGAAVAACDLRAGAALVLAGLAAEGETIISASHHLDRGYQRLERKLTQLGARIRRGTHSPLPYTKEGPSGTPGPVRVG